MSFTITRELDPLPSYAMLCKLAEQNQVRVTGNEFTGSFSGGGVDGHYEFDENGMRGTFVGHRITGHFSLESGKATVTVTEKPFWMPETLVKEKIAEGLDSFLDALRRGGHSEDHIG